MELQEYFRILRKRWPVIALTLLLTIGAAAAYTILAPKSYESKTALFVSTSASEGADSLLQGSSFTQQRVKSYADVIKSPVVLDPVIDELGLDVPSEVLEQRVTTNVPLDTVLIEVAVRDNDPQTAADIAEGIADQFIRTVGEIETSRGDRSAPITVTVTRPAAVPTVPVSPNPLLNLALGGVLGLLLGLVLALVRDMQDTSVKTEKEVREVTNEPIIGAIHFDSQAPKHPLVVQDDAHSVRAEAFRALRTNLQFVDAAHEIRTIAVTSSLPGEGKTTTAANLGVTMAEAGSSVCIIEADLRRPRLLDYLGMDGTVGLTNVLIGEADLDDVLQPFGTGRMEILGAGPIPPNPSELLGSPQMRHTLDDLERRFDYVLLDAPPVLPVTDAAVLGRICDGTILVAGSGVIKKEHLSRALEALGRVNASVLGIIVNRIPTKGVDAYSYYGEGYQALPPADTSETSLRRRTRTARGHKV